MFTGHSYDDVLLLPERSPVDSREDVNTSTEVVPGVSIEKPILSAAMDTVTETAVANAMANNGGCGVIHRFASLSKRVEMVDNSTSPVGAAIGLDESPKRLVTAGADFICLNVAHAHLEKCLDRVEEIDPDVPLMVGNVGTKGATKDLLDRGADSIRVGIGPGSACTTREMTGVGVPQLTAIDSASRTVKRHDRDATVIADGGIRQPGDAVKALMSGADAVMMGGEFARCIESPAPMVGGKKKVRGMASAAAQEEARGEVSVVEGEEYLAEQNGHVSEVLEHYNSGIRSGLSYCGGHTIEEARRKAAFVEKN